jgi:phosphatidate cytidylyltransferase
MTLSDSDPRAATVVDAPPTPRAGRNLPAAIAVGATLAALVVVPLALRRDIFGIGVVGAAVAFAMWEIARVLRAAGTHVPYLPLIIGGPTMVAAAYLRGTDGLSVALVATVLACIAWLLAEEPAGFLDNISASAFVLVYVALLGSFAALLAAPDDGVRRVVAFVATTVCSDVGGYTVGVLIGRHPMAPRISPKKSWEGFAGSTIACVAFGVLGVCRLFDLPIWQGVLFGAVVAVAATLGDLGESLIKRDLGIKDMSNLLPGHGGLMDRMDSLLVVAPIAWVMLSAWVPVPK